MSYSKSTAASIPTNSGSGGDAKSAPKSGGGGSGSTNSLPELKLQRIERPFHMSENHRGKLEALALSVTPSGRLGKPEFTASKSGPDHLSEWTCTCTCALTQPLAPGSGLSRTIVSGSHLQPDITVTPSTVTVDIQRILLLAVQHAQTKPAPAPARIQLRAMVVDQVKKQAEAKAASDVFDLFHYVQMCLTSPAAYAVATAAAAAASASANSNPNATSGGSSKPAQQQASQPAPVRAQPPIDFKSSPHAPPIYGYAQSASRDAASPPPSGAGATIHLPIHASINSGSAAGILAPANYRGKLEALCRLPAQPFPLSDPTFQTTSRGLDHMLDWQSDCTVKMLFSPDSVARGLKEDAAAAAAAADDAGDDGESEFANEPMIEVTVDNYLRVARYLLRSSAQAGGAGSAAGIDRKSGGGGRRSAIRELQLTCHRTDRQRKAAESGAAHDVLELYAAFTLALNPEQATPLQRVVLPTGASLIGASSGGGAANDSDAASHASHPPPPRFDPAENHRGRLEALVVKHPIHLKQLTFHTPTSEGPSHAPKWTCKCSVLFYASPSRGSLPEEVSHSVTDLRKRYAEALAASTVYDQCLQRLQNPQHYARLQAAAASAGGAAAAAPSGGAAGSGSGNATPIRSTPPPRVMTPVTSGGAPIAMSNRIPLPVAIPDSSSLLAPQSSNAAASATSGGAESVSAGDEEGQAPFSSSNSSSGGGASSLFSSHAGSSSSSGASGSVSSGMPHPPPPPPPGSATRDVKQSSPTVGGHTPGSAAVGSMWSNATANSSPFFSRPPPQAHASLTPTSAHSQFTNLFSGGGSGVSISPLAAAASVPPSPAVGASAATSGGGGGGGGGGGSGGGTTGTTAVAIPADCEVFGRIVFDLAPSLLAVFLSIEVTDDAIVDLMKVESNAKNDALPVKDQFPTLRHELSEAVKDKQKPFGFVQRLITKLKESPLGRAAAEAAAEADGASGAGAGAGAGAGSESAAAATPASKQ